MLWLNHAIDHKVAQFISRCLGIDFVPRRLFMMNWFFITFKSDWPRIWILLKLKVLEKRLKRNRWWKMLSKILATVMLMTSTWCHQTSYFQHIAVRIYHWNRESSWIRYVNTIKYEKLMKNRSISLSFKSVPLHCDAYTWLYTFVLVQDVKSKETNISWGLSERFHVPSPVFSWINQNKNTIKRQIKWKRIK